MDLTKIQSELIELRAEARKLRGGPVIDMSMPEGVTRQ